MPKLTYSELVDYVKRYQLQGRFDAVSFCMGYCGKLDQTHYDMIAKMYLDGIIKD